MIVLECYERHDIVLRRKPKKELVLVTPYLRLNTEERIASRYFLISGNPESLERFLKTSGIPYTVPTYDLLDLNRVGRRPFSITKGDLEEHLKVLTKEFSIPMIQEKGRVFIEGW